MPQTQNEPLIDQVRTRLQKARGTWADVSAKSGVPYHTLAKIAQGQVTNPRVRTVQRLMDHFDGVKRAA